MLGIPKGSLPVSVGDVIDHKLLLGRGKDEQMLLIWAVGETRSSMKVWSGVWDCWDSSLMLRSWTLIVDPRVSPFSFEILLLGYHDSPPHAQLCEDGSILLAGQI